MSEMFIIDNQISLTSLSKNILLYEKLQENKLQPWMNENRLRPKLKQRIY